MWPRQGFPAIPPSQNSRETFTKGDPVCAVLLIVLIKGQRPVASMISASHDSVMDEALSFVGIKLWGSVISSCIDFLKIGLLVFSKT